MSKYTATVPALQENGLTQYIQSIWKIPMLDADSEYALAKRYSEDHDLEAAKELVCSHLRLVVKMAMQFKGYGLSVTDMISEGNIGLMRAVQKFDPDKGFRLSTYAMWWIKASITEYILRSWSLVKMGTLAAQKRLFFSLRRVKEQLGIHDEGELTASEAQQLEKEIGLPAQEIKNFNQRLSHRDTSLNVKIGDNGQVELQDTLESESDSPELMFHTEEVENLQKRILSEAIQSFSEREQVIIQRRFLQQNPDTLESIGNDLGISRERVRQLEGRVFERLANIVKHKVTQLGGLQNVVV